MVRHTRDEVIERINREFQLLDQLVANLTPEDWDRLVSRPASREPWMVKDVLAHITHWKAGAVRSARRQPQPPEERGLGITAVNHLIYMRWHDRSPWEVLAWHRQVHQDVLAALKELPQEWFSAKERSPEWPFDLTGHSADHRVKDIQRALAVKR
jgi:hypothetical protein